MLFSEKSKLAQLGCIVDKKILFPKSYPYTSSTTKILRQNFADLYNHTLSIIKLDKNDLIIDIGSNDGNLLSNFKSNHRVLINPSSSDKNSFHFLSCYVKNNNRYCDFEEIDL